MTDRSEPTRDKLLTAGEHLFARAGIDGTLTRQIVAGAGQANDSAVNYHFGSRTGLLAAIIDRHMSGIESRQPSGPLPDDIDGLVEVIVRPISGELRTPSGRDFLRITAQLAGRSGVTTASMAQPLRHSSVGIQLDSLADLLGRDLPETTARERLNMLIGMLTAVLADRAHRLDDDRAVLLAHDEFVDNTIAMLSAAVSAPLRLAASGSGRSGHPSPRRSPKD